MKEKAKLLNLGWKYKTKHHLSDTKITVARSKPEGREMCFEIQQIQIDWVVDEGVEAGGDQKQSDW